MKKNNWLITAAIFGFLGVALGAFGAHYLKAQLTEDMLKTFNTGVLYHLIHSGVILAIALSGKRYKLAQYFFAAGIILFSFSLYIYSNTGIKLFAMITPLGGFSFLTGWLSLVYYGFVQPKE